MTKERVQNSILRLLGEDIISKDILKSRIEPMLDDKLYDAAVYELEKLNYIKFIKTSDSFDLRRTDLGYNALLNELISEPKALDKIKTHINEMNNVYTLIIAIMALVLSMIALLRG